MTANELTMSPLDADMFPHLMDAIVQAAPHAALLRLRGTSRHFRTACDTALAHHLSIEVTDPRFREPGKRYDGFAPVCLGARAGRVPHLRDWPYGGKLEDEADDSDPADLDESSTPAARLKYATASLAATRVLDIIGPVDPAYLEWLSNRIDTGRLTLRFRLNADREPGTGEGLVANTKPSPRNASPSNTAVVFTLLYPENRRDHPVAPIGLVPDGLGITRLVINVAFDPANPFLPIGAVDGFYYPKDIDEVVILFNARTDLPFKTPTLAKMQSISGNMRHPPGILDNVAYLLAPQLRTVRHTFVNLASVPVMAFGIDEPPQPFAPEEVYALIAGYLKAAFLERRDDAWDGDVRFDDWPDHEIDEAIARNVQFLGLEEYRQTLPPDEFALQIVE